MAFEPNKSALEGAAQQAWSGLAKGLVADKQKTAGIDLLTRETENLPSAQRRQLAQERAKAVSDASSSSVMRASFGCAPSMQCSANERDASASRRIWFSRLCATNGL